MAESSSSPGNARLRHHVSQASRDLQAKPASCWLTKWAWARRSSLAASAMLAALLDDGPVLILCPSTLTLQWQVELKDKLGIPSAVWLSAKKVWMDEHGPHH